MEQLDLWSLLPGASGGRALRDQRGTDYLLTIASGGGAETVRRYGIEHMRRLASAGGQAKRDKRYTQPRTVETWYGTIEREIPYWPHQPRRRRRKRPVIVRIELGEVQR